MRHATKVQYRPSVGAFRKIPRDLARKYILADYDKSPMRGTALFNEALNARLKGVTVEEFLAERDKVNA